MPSSCATFAKWRLVWITYEEMTLDALKAPMNSPVAAIRAFAAARCRPRVEIVSRESTGGSRRFENSRRKRSWDPAVIKVNRPKRGANPISLAPGSWSWTHLTKR